MVLKGILLRRCGGYLSFLEMLYMIYVGFDFIIHNDTIVQNCNFFIIVENWKFPYITVQCHILKSDSGLVSPE